jgi:hypothetical protein
MIVRCIGTSFGALEGRPELAGFMGAEPNVFANQNVPLQVGTEYLVAAISFGPSLPWFFVCDRSPGLIAPILAPCLLLEVRDSRCSRSWQAGTWLDRFDNHHGLLAPACWANDAMFHGKVFDGDDDAVRQMAVVRSELLLEFPLPWIAETAIAVGSGALVADPEWNDIWEANSTQAMTVNPKTGAMFHNPLNRSVNKPVRG